MASMRWRESRLRPEATPPGEPVILLKTGQTPGKTEDLVRTLAEVLPRQREAPAAGADNHRTLGTATLQRMDGEGNERKFTEASVECVGRKIRYGQHLPERGASPS